MNANIQCSSITLHIPLIQKPQYIHALRERERGRERCKLATPQSVAHPWLANKYFATKSEANTILTDVPVEKYDNLNEAKQAIQIQLVFKLIIYLRAEKIFFSFFCLNTDCDMTVIAHLILLCKQNYIRNTFISCSAIVQFLLLNRK